MTEEKKDISLWVLVDNRNKIYYTAYSEELLEPKKEQLSHIPNLKIVKLEGEKDV